MAPGFYHDKPVAGLSFARDYSLICKVKTVDDSRLLDYTQEISFAIYLSEKNVDVRNKI